MAKDWEDFFRTVWIRKLSLAHAAVYNYRCLGASGKYPTPRPCGPRRPKKKKKKDSTSRLWCEPARTNVFFSCTYTYHVLQLFHGLQQILQLQPFLFEHGAASFTLESWWILFATMSRPEDILCVHHNIKNVPVVLDTDCRHFTLIKASGSLLQRQWIAEIYHFLPYP